VVAMAAQVPSFHMPGTGIPGFAKHSRIIANAGIYDMAIFLEHVLVPVVLGHWRLKSLEGLSPEAELARDKVLRHVERLKKFVARQAERRAEVPAHSGVDAELTVTA
jgi:acyl-[acyl-carrier-protein] desaturase